MILYEHLNTGSVRLLILATPILMVLSRNIASPVFACVVLLLAGIAIKESGRASLVHSVVQIARSPAMAVSGALLCLMAVSTFWSSAGQRGFESTLHLAGNLALFVLALASLRNVARPLPRNPWYLALVLVFTATLIVVELHFGSPIRTLVGAASEAFRMNRAAVAIVLFLPLALQILPGGRFSVVLKLITVITVGYAAFLSESESAKLALAVTILAFPVFVFLKQRAVWFLGGLVILSLVAMPLMAPHVMSLIPEPVAARLPYGSVGIRADIWTAHASLLKNAPLFGHGVEASIMAAQDYRDTDIPELFLQWGHPHNFVMQVWYELGFSGVALFAVLLFLFFRSLTILPVTVLPALLSTISAVWTVSLVSHGAWQAWWWCLTGLLGLVWLIGLKTPGTAREHSQ